ncbi:MAG: hypothetical protein ACK55Z_26550, partial [bacterium]
MRKKIRPPTKFDFLKGICFLWRRAWKKYNISFICTELEIIRGEKLIFQNFGPFSALSVQSRPNFGRSFVRPLYFLFGPFLSYAVE